MLVAQKLNGEKLIHGAYIVGQFWYFVVMKNRKYNVFTSLDSAILVDLEIIMSKLNWVKKYMTEKLANK